MIEFDNFDLFFLPNNVFLPPLFDSCGFLTKLTGFTCSFAAVFLKKGGGGFFFTDDRYVVQAKLEIDSIFEIKNINELSNWIKDNLDICIGIDSRLQTRRWNNIIGNAKLYIIDHDRLDDFYVKNFIQNNHVNKNNIYIYSRKYSGMTHCLKIKNFLSSFDHSNDNFFITDPENVSWLLNIRSNNINYNQNVSCCAIASREGIVDLFLLNTQGVEVENVNIHNIGEIINVIKKRNIKNLLMDKNQSTLYFVNLFAELKIDVDYIDDPIYLMRAIKNVCEIDNSVNIHLYDGIALTKFILYLIYQFENENFSISERDAVLKLRKFRMQNVNFIRESFATIAAFGPNGAIIHYNPEINKAEEDIFINKSNLFLLDSGGHYLGGTTDVTRTMTFGDPTLQQKKYYTLVLKGNIRLQNAVFPIKTKGIDLDILARYDLLREGLNYKHSTGHGVSNFLNVHEKIPLMSKFDDTYLQPGMIISNEPGYYRENYYGIRLENLMVVRQRSDGLLYFECLTQVPFFINLVDFAMLTLDEKEWLKNYNQGIFEKLKSFLRDNEKSIYIKNFLF